MNKELIINAGPSEVDIALLEDKQLVEINQEKRNNEYVVGDIYLGKVRKIIPGLNAAFVDVGYEKDAFLHYLDLGPQINSLKKIINQAFINNNVSGNLDKIFLEKDIDKSGKISNVLNTNQPILVQIAKEPISAKGPRITSEISLAGRYLVLVPFTDRISISQKIKSVGERNRLKRLVNSIKPKNFGVIIRTVAENKKVADLDADLQELVGRWSNIITKLKSKKPPAKILSEKDRTTTILRDLLNDSFNNIHVNDNALYEEIRNYLRTIAPDLIDIVKLHKKNEESLFEKFGIDKQIKSAFGKRVNIKNGAYLIIEHTEAMHVIDVNSGHRLDNQTNQEENALDVNLAAAQEIARQLRLRDMGGIIVVDFIDLHNKENRKTLFDSMRNFMKHDKAKHAVLPPSKFGLIQITRQRVRPEMVIQTLEKCPACDGTGKIKPSVLLIDEIESNLSFLIREQNEKKLTLITHPFVYAYLTKGLFSHKCKWFFKFKRCIKIKYAKSYHALEFKFFNKNGNEINI